MMILSKIVKRDLHSPKKRRVFVIKRPIFVIEGAGNGGEKGYIVDEFA